MNVPRQMMGALAIACAGLASGDELAGQFRWCVPLEGSFQAGSLYRVATPAAVFEGCRKFPADVRILEEGGRQWPFYLWVPLAREEVQAVPAERLNASLVEGAERFLRQDLRIAPDPVTGKAREHNQVTLRTPGRDFIRRVEVYGREEGAEWGFLGAGYLVDHARDVSASNATVPYALSTLPLLQVRLFPNARAAAEPLSIAHLSAGICVRHPGEVEAVALQESPVPEASRRADCQVLVFDLGARGRPLERLRIRAAETEYARSVRVSGRDDETSAWGQLAEGEIHRIGQEMQDEVRLAPAEVRFVKLEMFHYDDPPLTGVSVEGEASPRYLVFEAGSGQKPAIYFGSDVGAPRYDLERRTQPAAAAAAPLGKVMPREENPRFKPQVPDLLERHGRWLAVAAVAAVSLLVMAVILGMLKKQGAGLPEESEGEKRETAGSEKQEAPREEQGGT